MMLSQNLVMLEFHIVIQHLLLPSLDTIWSQVCCPIEKTIESVAKFRMCCSNVSIASPSYGGSGIHPSAISSDQSHDPITLNAWGCIS